MEPGKIILLAVCGFLLVSLWSDESTSALKESVDTDVATTAPTYPDAPVETAPSRPLSFPANVTLATAADYERDHVHRYHSDADEERTYRSYADEEDEHFDTFKPRVSREADYVRSEHPETGTTYSLTFTVRDYDGERLRGSGNTRGQSGSGYLRSGDGRHYWLELVWENRRDLIGIADDGSIFELDYELLDR